MFLHLSITVLVTHTHTHTEKNTDHTALFVLIYCVYQRRERERNKKKCFFSCSFLFCFLKYFFLFLSYTYYLVWFSLDYISYISYLHESLIFYFKSTSVDATNTVVSRSNLKTINYTRASLHFKHTVLEAATAVVVPYIYIFSNNKNIAAL